MQAFLDIILPVFMIIGVGYVAVWRKYFTDSGVEGLMRFTQGFAIPCLLFRSISTLDLGQDFDVSLLVAFYGAAIICFGLGILGARYIFKRPIEDCIAIGFCCLFSNSLLLGLPISERAFGADSLSANYAIIAIHSPLCYGLGITAMEIARNRGGNALVIFRSVLKAMFSNALVIGIALGLVVNIGHIPMPGIVTDAIDLMVQAALPAALFGLGGILYRYRPEGDMKTILFVCAISLLVHPALAWMFGKSVQLPDAAFNSMILTAAMSPGVNAYLFANMYGAARRVAASAVLFGTFGTIFTAWAWLTLLN